MNHHHYPQQCFKQTLSFWCYDKVHPVHSEKWEATMRGRGYPLNTTWITTTYAMARQETGVSYRRSRNYQEKFQWTFELNQDLYQFYKKAREDPSIGYMKRMKSYWDVKYPNYSHFSAKQLRQQDTFVNNAEQMAQSIKLKENSTTTKTKM